MVAPTTGRPCREGTGTATVASPEPRCTMCSHQPLCPSADSSDRCAAITVAAHHEQGWALMCNGVIVFDDSGAPAFASQPLTAA